MKWRLDQDTEVLKGWLTQRVTCPVLVSPCTQERRASPAMFSLIQHQAIQGRGYVGGSLMLEREAALPTMQWNFVMTGDDESCLEGLGRCPRGYDI